MNPIVQGPRIVTSLGVQSAFGYTLPPGGRVAAFVGPSSLLDGADKYFQDNRVDSIVDALPRCRSGYQDTIFCMPGYTENLPLGTEFANLVAGTRIIGLGSGSNQATWRHTATASRINIAVNDVTISGMFCKFEGAVVTKAMYVTGADFKFIGNRVLTSSGASNVATIVCEFDTGAARFIVDQNKVYGLLAGASTDGFLITAALSDWEITRNKMVFPSTATTKGLIQVAGASLNGLIADNDLYNTVAASTVCIYFADVASDGICSRNSMACTVGTGTAPAVTGIVLAGTNTLWRFNENYSTPTKNTSGLVTPAVDS